MNLQDTRVNDAARSVAAQAVSSVPPLKVPLSESVTGGIIKVSTRKSTGPHVMGVPYAIGDVLKAHPAGLDCMTIAHILRTKQMVPNNYDTKKVGAHLSAMKGREMVRLMAGSIWKLGDKPIEFARSKRGGTPVNGVAIPQVVEVKKKGVRPKTKRTLTKQERAPRDLMAETTIENAVNALERALDSLRAARQLMADLDTREFTLKQREEALNAAKKLLAGV